MTTAEAQSFLREAAKYFRARPTNGEDRAYWSNVYNADNCEKIADLIERMTVPLVSPSPGRDR